MSQKELADKVGLTPSFISQLESNQIVPSLQLFHADMQCPWRQPFRYIREKIRKRLNGSSEKKKHFLSLSIKTAGARKAFVLSKTGP